MDSPLTMKIGYFYFISSESQKYFDLKWFNRYKQFLIFSGCYIGSKQKKGCNILVWWIGKEEIKESFWKERNNYLNLMQFLSIKMSFTGQIGVQSKNDAMILVD